MKLKVGLLDTDEFFVSRLVSALNEYKKEEFVIYPFPSFDKARIAAKTMGLHVLLVEEGLEIDPSLLACPYIYISEQNSADFPKEDGGKKRICKYRSITDWYSLLCSFCSVNPTSTEGGEETDTGTKQMKLCLFISGGGGAGSSTAAAAFALHLAKKGKPVVYLNFENFPSTDLFFEGTANYDMSDLIFAVRSHKYEMETLVKHAICRDESGVQFIHPCPITSDRFSLSGEEIIQICQQVFEGSNQATLVVDMNVDGTESFILPFLYAQKTVIVSNGKWHTNQKTEQLLDSLPFLCNLTAFEVAQKVLLLYNQFHPNGGQLLELPELGKLGGIHEVEAKTEKERLFLLEPLSPFQRLEEQFYV